MNRMMVQAELVQTPLECTEAVGNGESNKTNEQAVSLVEKRLMDVKLGELGSWLGGRDFTPNGIISAVSRGRDRYYNKYINVKRGGIGGIAMLLAGYVAISYLWEFDHISKKCTLTFLLLKLRVNVSSPVCDVHLPVPTSLSPQYITDEKN
ncbi:hypothetical protein F2P81_014734 [Scophthalmus maximus]|uniref:Uncharacterized protein n=1 Tax=Scophthalmus maximus TaxID=52904 RepID=A0A6A4SMX1_SCOMX|nr:hypothetical protein F2P81_014734 [Scophthalmus maximus]